MNDLPDSRSRCPSGGVSFAAGGWVLILAAALTLGTVGWHVAVSSSSRNPRAAGDGKNVSTYGFDLSTCLIPSEQIIAAGMLKDSLPALSDPPTVPGREVALINKEMRGKFLVSQDRAIGVSIDGSERAYPIRMLNWHEVVNDTLGGVPIAVIYNPLCDSAVVFDRRVAGETLSFGVSGLLYNSNMLIYDRQPEPGKESLWNPLQFRAVAGPAAELGRQLTVLLSSVVQWESWHTRHPNTDVLSPAPAMLDRYKREPYGSYYGSDGLRFPVSPLPPTGLARKAPVLVVGAGVERRVIALATIATKAGPTGVWRTPVGDTAISLTYRAEPPTVLVELNDPSRSIEAVYCFWFAWYAMHPGAAFE